MSNLLGIAFAAFLTENVIATVKNGAAKANGIRIVFSTDKYAKRKQNNRNKKIAVDST